MSKSRITKRGVNKPRHTIKQVEEALMKHGGIIAVAARSLGLSRETLSNRVNGSKILLEVRDRARESMIDVAEVQLTNKIREGNMAAIIFYLKTQAKHRGYIERGEVSGVDGKPIEVDDMRGKSIEELRKIAGIAEDGETVNKG